MAATKHEVTLKFPSFYTMWTYIRITHLQFYELDYAAAILHGPCTDEEIELAVNNYGAKLISRTLSPERKSH